jgi:hypothetical protein
MMRKGAPARLNRVSQAGGFAPIHQTLRPDFGTNPKYHLQCGW